MNVVFIKNNEFDYYEYETMNGYSFRPKKNITKLVIVDENLIKLILHKRIDKDIKKVSKTVKLILNSNATIISDCDMMLDEVFKLIKKIEKKYKDYFNEFEYFDFIKELYGLNMEINLKKKILENE